MPSRSTAILGFVTGRFDMTAPYAVTIPLLKDVKAGRTGDGIVAAVGLIGEVLAEHFPKSGDDTNEIPDKLIEL